MAFTWNLETTFRIDTCSLNQENNWEAVIRFLSTCHAQHCVCSLSSSYYLKHKKNKNVSSRYETETYAAYDGNVLFKCKHEIKIIHSLNKRSFKAFSSREIDWSMVLWFWPWEIGHVWLNPMSFFNLFNVSLSRYLKTACHQQMFCIW